MCSLVRFRLLMDKDAADPDCTFGDSFWVNVSSVTCNVMAWATTVHRHSIAANTPMQAIGLLMVSPSVPAQRPVAPAPSLDGRPGGQHAWMTEALCTGKSSNVVTLQTQNGVNIFTGRQSFAIPSFTLPAPVPHLRASFLWH